MKLQLPIINIGFSILAIFLKLVEGGFMLPIMRLYAVEADRSIAKILVSIESQVGLSAKLLSLLSLIMAIIVLSSRLSNKAMSILSCLVALSALIFTVIIAY